MFKVELSGLVDPDHGLVKLSGQVNWERLEAAFGQTYCPDNGRPGCSTRLMVALQYLKFTHDLSDEAVVAIWVENPYWQYFSGMKFFEYCPPIDPSSMSNWRKRIGEAGAEELLRETIEAGLKLKAIKPTQLQRVNVDTTVQEKHVRFPTDARLYDRARARLVNMAQARGVVLRQSYRRVGKRFLVQQQRYAHARQMKRAGRCTRKLRTILGRVIRDIERKRSNPDAEFDQLLHIARRIHEQQRHDKNKVYSVHAPEVECLSKGKAHKRYEFGCKVSVAATSKGGWFVGAQAIHGNPYDGHTLSEALEQIERVAGRAPNEAFVDLGYRGHKVQGETEVHVVPKRRGKIPRRLWRWMKRRAAVEPGIGHLKQEHRMDRNRLHGRQGDQINAILSAAGMNFGKLVRHAEAFLRLWMRLRRYANQLGVCLIALSSSRGRHGTRLGIQALA
jgi:IS5 family transposase